MVFLFLGLEAGFERFFQAHLRSFVNVMSAAADLEPLGARVEDQGGPGRPTDGYYSSTPHEEAFVVAARRP